MGNDWIVCALFALSEYIANCGDREISVPHYGTFKASNLHAWAEADREAALDAAIAEPVAAPRDEGPRDDRCMCGHPKSEHGPTWRANVKLHDATCLAITPGGGRCCPCTEYRPRAPEPESAPGGCPYGECGPGPTGVVCTGCKIDREIAKATPPESAPSDGCPRCGCAEYETRGVKRWCRDCEITYSPRVAPSAHVYGDGCTTGHCDACGTWHCMSHLVPGGSLSDLADCPKRAAPRDEGPRDEDDDYGDECRACGGEGFSRHDCGEDSCCCAAPEPNVRCSVCHGSGERPRAPEPESAPPPGPPSSPDRCKCGAVSLWRNPSPDACAYDDITKIAHTRRGCARDPNTAQSERQTPDATGAPPARDFMKPTAASGVSAALPEEVERTMNDLGRAEFNLGLAWNDSPELRAAAADEASTQRNRLRAAISSALGARDAALAKANEVIAGTAYPSDVTLTREQAFHGWEVANRQRDRHAQRAEAAESRASAAAEHIDALLKECGCGCCAGRNWDDVQARARAFLDGEAGRKEGNEE